MWRTWANLLTAVRFVCIAPCAWAIVSGQWVVAAVLFTIAVMTDLFDGPLARRLQDESTLGGLFDHTTDALFVATALAALAWAGLLNPLLPLLVVAAFIQYFLDSQALAGHRLKTSWLGKNNGVAYYVLVGVPVIRNAIGWDWPPNEWITAFSWLLSASTLASMIDRLLALLRKRR